LRNVTKALKDGYRRIRSREAIGAGPTPLTVPGVLRVKPGGGSGGMTTIIIPEAAGGQTWGKP
jgi:hypothetical protein